MTQALKDLKLHQAMSEEYDALVRNGTWELVPQESIQNLVSVSGFFVLKGFLVVLLTGRKLVSPKGFINNQALNTTTPSAQWSNQPPFVRFLALPSVAVGHYVNWILIMHLSKAIYRRMSLWYNHPALLIKITLLMLVRLSVVSGKFLVLGTMNCISFLLHRVSPTHLPTPPFLSSTPIAL